VRTHRSISGPQGVMKVALAALSVSALGILAVGPIANAQDASSAPAQGFLFIDSDVVLGPVNLTDEEKPTLTCVQNSRFAHNEDVVWRVKVLDPLTGQPMDDTTLASLEVVLPTETLSLHYGGHPRDTPVDFFWTTSWVVPEDYPTGAVDYTITATALDGRTGTWNQFGVTLAQLTITDEVRAIIVPPTPAPSE
jgi:hypothetical protein